PWRYVMVAGSPGELLENNYFIQNLNEPNKLEDVSWIKPGKVIREVTLTTQGGRACIDFAARHNIQYVEFDAGWYGNEYDDKSDASTITVDPRRSPGPLDLHHVIEYGNQKGIGIILYVNRRALEKQIDELLPLYKSWGIKGLKYGFVNVGPQEWTSWLHDAVRKAADHQLMVDIHDEYRPTGYSRTFPNLMTQEGIRGDEETPSVKHSIITLFTRMIAGAGDNTNCYFADRVSQSMGGKAGQMAKAIMLYSPWQFVYWYDRPSDSPHKKGGAGANETIINERSDLLFYDALPTNWDETKVLEGEMGEYATIARKSGNDWFIGSLAADQSRKVDIPLSFLDKGANYEALVYYQNGEDLKNDEVRTEKIMVNRKSVVSKQLMKDSGLAMIIRKI
ncbi:MAG: glycoside hydrolase family 97 catalytic domain-containing protein, partial [Marinilabiliaceae bacterium]|nr:glycoside hydrolase family 97 catalytic domain-containing protein [Marinilabiliaceae bacterium]